MTKMHYVVIVSSFMEVAWQMAWQVAWQVAWHCPQQPISALD